MSQMLAAGIGPTTRPKISFAGVNKLYGDNRARVATTLALHDFDLDIAPEEIVSIVGPTGCGKSTSLNLLAGFEQTSSRFVSVDGQAVTDPGARPWRGASGVRAPRVAPAERGRPRGLRAPLPVPTLGRHAAARPDRARADQRARHPLVDEPSCALDYQTLLKESGLAGKLQPAMQVLHATKSISEPVPISVIQNAINPSHPKAFAASDLAR